MNLLTHQKTREERGLPKLAVIDDDQNMRIMLSEILALSGEFDSAGSYAGPGEALRVLPQKSPDLALIDYLMPEMNGIELARHLTAILPKLKIVLITGVNNHSVLNNDSPGHRYAVLYKPFHPPQCLDIINVALARHYSGGLLSTAPRRSPETSSTIGTSFSKTQKGRALTDLEEQVMRGLADGRSYKEIVSQQGWTMTKFRRHQHKAYAKLVKAGNKIEAVNEWKKRNGQEC